MRIIELVQKNRNVKLAGNDRLRIDREIAEPRERAQFVRDLLRSLGRARRSRPELASVRRQRAGFHASRCLTDPSAARAQYWT